MKLHWIADEGDTCHLIGVAGGPEEGGEPVPAATVWATKDARGFRWDVWENGTGGDGGYAPDMETARRRAEAAWNGRADAGMAAQSKEGGMDPDANLAEQLELAARLAEAAAEAEICELDNDALDILFADGQRLAELVQALDSWIRNGGFLPGRWRKP